MDRLKNFTGFSPSSGAQEPLLASAGSSQHPYTVIADQCQPPSPGVQGEAELLPSIEISCMFTELLSFLEGIY